MSFPAPSSPTRPDRTIAVWLPAWPLTAAAQAAGCASDLADRPMAVLAEGRVSFCNEPARRQGIHRGQRKREAESLDPALLILPHDRDIAAHAFEPVIAALEAVAAGVEITRPGLATIGARGVIRFYGGEIAAITKMTRALSEVPVAVAGGAMLGVADGAAAAALAARTGTIVPPGGSPEFLAPLPIDVLGHRQESPLVDILIRLGITTLGAFSRLPPNHVYDRFGPQGARAHRIASGREDRPLSIRKPPPNSAVCTQFDPPLDRADAVAFSSRSAAHRFIAQLTDRGLACTCVEVTIELMNSEQAVRRWRHTGWFTSSSLIDRIRWQLEGILSTSSRQTREFDEVTAVTFNPLEVEPLDTQQHPLWGDEGRDRDEHAERGIARIQAIYGRTSVTRLILQGGSSPAKRTGRVIWGDPVTPASAADQPWPAHLPHPIPAVIFDLPKPLTIVDAQGTPVFVTKRGILSSPAAAFILDGSRRSIAEWTGPWLDTEDFWSPGSIDSVHQVRCQFVDTLGRAYVVTCRTGAEPTWLLEGIYD